MLTDEELALGGLRFEDLVELKICTNRTDLQRKQDELGFPLPVKTGASQAMFLKSEVYAWLRERAAQREAQPKSKKARVKAEPAPQEKVFIPEAMRVRPSKQSSRR